MRVLLFVFIVLFSLPAIAQDAGTKPEAQPATRIEVDEEAGVIRFIVKGKKVALLDETGLHVHEDADFRAPLRVPGVPGADAPEGAVAAPAGHPAPGTEVRP